MENLLGRCTHCSIQMWWGLRKAATLSPPGGHSCTRRLGPFEFSFLKLAFLNWNFLQTIFYLNKTVRLISHLNYFGTFLLLKPTFTLHFDVDLQGGKWIQNFIKTSDKHQITSKWEKKHTLVGVRARRLVVWVTHVRLEMKRGKGSKPDQTGPVTSWSRVSRAAAIEMSERETVIR